MTFKVVKGDLVEFAKKGTVDVLVHGCNCKHAMGSGIAKTIADAFPEMHKADLCTTYGSPAKLGTFSKAEVEISEQVRFTGVNLYTQYTIGADFIPSILPYALIRLNEHFSGRTLWFPMIGCGIGGGDWQEVMTMMVKHLTHVNVVVVVYS